MRSSSRRRFGRVVALAAGPLALASLLLAPPASAAPTGTVTGAVVDDTGAPVAGLAVSARTGDNTVLATVHTASDGSYRLTAPAGPRVVCFDGTGVATASGGYRFTCFGGATATTATPVRIVADQVRPGVDGTVTRRAVISGRVTDSAGPLTGVGIRRSPTGPVETTTGTDGRYRLVVDPIDQPSTTVCFEGATATGGTSTAGYLDACSASFPLTPGTVRIVNQVLAPAAGAAGRVTDAAGQPVAGAEVLVVADPSDTVRTDTDGRWRLTGLRPPPGGATLLATPPTDALGPDGTGLLERCYGGTTPVIGFCQGGAVFTLTAGQVKGGLNSVLPSGGALTGQVTDNAGTPIPGVAVTLSIDDTRDLFPKAVSSGPDGRWRANGLRPGTYSVCVHYAAEVRSPDPDGYDAECLGAGVTVRAAQVVISAPLVLTGRGRVVGRVVDAATGRGIPGVQVVVGAPGQLESDIRRVVTGTDGSYTVGALPVLTTGACTYVTATVTSQPPLGYADSCPYGAGFLKPTKTFVVRERGITTAPVIRLAENGTVAGRVTDAAGFALQNVGVYVQDPATGEADTVTTDALGAYVTAPFAAGQIVVCFFDTATARRTVDGTRPAGGYQEECWDNSNAPTPLTLQPGQRRTGIDATLAAVRPTG